MTDALTIMMRDPGAAIGAVVHDRAPGGFVYGSYIEYMRAAHAESGKPVALVAARQGSGFDERVVTSTHEGLPVLDGLPSFLRGVRALFDYRDFLARNPAHPAEAPAWAVGKWRELLAVDNTLDEVQSLSLLRDFELPAAECAIATNESEAILVANKLGYPLALNTAMPGMLHKSEHRGVHLAISNEAELVEKYNDLLDRVGARALLSPMAMPGIEMILGVRRDPQFGPVVMLGFGGTLAEVLRDVTFALPPFDAAHARRCIDKLRLRALLDGVRGKKAVDVDAFCSAAATFSTMVHALRDELQEVDVNPVIVSADHCTAVDALVISRLAS
jgi:acyl-CoA synthetase (NDP forming)